MSNVSSTTAAVATLDADLIEGAVASKKRKQRKAGSGNNRMTIGRAAAWGVLTLVMIASLFPVYWALRTALSNNNVIIRDTGTIYPPEITSFNFQRVFGWGEITQAEIQAAGANDVKFDIWPPLKNSLITSTLITVGQVFFCAMSAYAFARLKFKGREVVFTIFLSALMVPPIFALIPNLLLIRDMEVDVGIFAFDLGWLPFTDDKTGWTSTYPGLVAPYILMTPFAIFFLRQFFIGISKEVEEAAVLDGAGHARRFFQVILPMSAAPIFTLALITYVNSWNEFLWPFTAGKNLEVITVALNDFRAQTPGTTRPDWSGLMTATFISGAPILILFAVFGRKVVDSIQFSGIK